MSEYVGPLGYDLNLKATQVEPPSFKQIVSTPDFQTKDRAAEAALFRITYELRSKLLIRSLAALSLGSHTARKIFRLEEVLNMAHILLAYLLALPHF